MRAKWFFRLFPPPIFLTMPYAGLEISDDAIRCLSYKGLTRNRRRIAAYGAADLPKGIIEAGEVKDEKALKERLADFGRQHGLSYVKVSVPEEKSYLFQTEVPDLGVKAQAQNIEFKLEENVPLSAEDAVFYFAVLSEPTADGQKRANVSVVPRVFIERHMEIIEAAGMKPAAFEVAPRSLARAVVPMGSPGAKIIVHAMSRKTGIDVVSEDVVRFSSTVAGGTDDLPTASNETFDNIGREVSRVYSYWMSHGGGRTVDGIILAGRGAAAFEGLGRHVSDVEQVPVSVADVWVNALDPENGVPPISKEDSLGYAVASGLAIDPSLEPETYKHL